MNRPVSNTVECEQCLIVRQLRQGRSFLDDELEELRQAVGRKNVELADKLQELHNFYRKQSQEERIKHKAELGAANRKIAELEAKLAVLEKEKAKTSKNRPDKFDGEDIQKEASANDSGKNAAEGETEEGKKKKKRTGHRKGGRKNDENLPRQIHFIEVQSPVCCGIPMQKARLLTHRISRTVHVVFEAVARELHRERAVFICACCGREAIAEAAAELKIFNSKYSLQTLIQQLVDHVRHQIPVHRLVHRLQDLGLKYISDGTLFNIFAALSEQLVGLDQAIIERNQQADCFEVDASGIPVRKEEEEDQRQDMESNHWPMWQIRTFETIVYVLTSRQRTDDLLVYFAPILDRISRTGPVRIMADRAKNIRVLEHLGFLVAFCWVHVRRDFIKLGRGDPKHLPFARKWVDYIKEGFRLDRKRRESPPGSVLFQQADEQLRTHLQETKDRLLQSLDDPELPDEHRKVLNSLKDHWHGLTLFLDHLCLPMHNNNVERGYRWLALFRRISFACANKERAHDKARFYTILQTLELHNINPVPYLCAFLIEQAHSKAKDVPMPMEEWVPWSMSDRVKKLIHPEHDTSCVP